MYLFKSNMTAREVMPSSPYRPSETNLARRLGSPTHLQLLEQHVRDTGIAPTRLGRLISNDPRLIGDMRNGREIGPEVVDRIDLYLSGYFRGIATQRKGGE